MFYLAVAYKEGKINDKTLLIGIDTEIEHEELLVESNLFKKALNFYEERGKHFSVAIYRAERVDALEPRVILVKYMPSKNGEEYIFYDYMKPGRTKNMTSLVNISEFA